MKILLVILWMFFSLHVFAPGKIKMNYVFEPPKKWIVELIQYNELFRAEYFDKLLVELKSSETWHDSLNYKYGNPYQKVNGIGAMGAWQFMPGTLRFLGYKDLSFKRFLNDKNLQRKYMIQLIQYHMFLLKKQSKTYKITPYNFIGEVIHSVEISLSGLLAASHLAGVGGIQKFLVGKRNATDGTSSVKSYLIKFKNIMNPKTIEAYQLFQKGILAFARAEQQGIRVDVPYIERKIQTLTRKANRLEDQFKSTQFYREWEKSAKGKVNINSSTQLSNLLYNVMKLTPPKYTESGEEEFKEFGYSEKGSTNIESLQTLNIPELNLLIERNKLIKLRDTNLDGYLREQVDGYIHPFFNLHTARSFRSSSSSINFQNQPIRDEESMQICRGALYPRPGHQLLEIDYSGLEVHISCCYHKDPTMLKYINDPTTDMHRDMAKQLFKIDQFDKNIPSHYTLRQAAKNGFVFPEFYGSYWKNCAANLACTWGKLPQGKWKSGQGIDMIGWEPKFNNFHLSDHLISKGIKEFGEINKDKNGKTIVTGFLKHVKEIEEDFWENRFPVYTAWKDHFYDGYKLYGYVDSFTGFRYSGFMTKRDVISYPIQGSAFHCMLWSFITLDKIIYELRKLDSRLIGQIHDSIIIDVNPNELNKIAKITKRVTCKDLLEAWDWICVPLDVEMALSPVDCSWAEKEKFKIS
jgi:hypothetical protein